MVVSFFKKKKKIYYVILNKFFRFIIIGIIESLVDI